jgi:hypothetical protein
MGEHHATYIGDPMLTRFCLSLTPVVVALLSLPLFAEDGAIIVVNPVGEPRGLTQGNAVRYFLWCDAEGWHVRTDSGGKPHVFNGSLSVKGGKITAISDFENLEAGTRKKKADLGIVNNARNQITFKFTTSKKRDGFDFQVDESAKEIRFHFLIDGKTAPQRVLIGPAGQPAPTDVLILPAHPE